MKKGDKEIPQSLDHFKAVGDYASIFNEIFGDKPTSVEVVFISDNDEVSCNERLELRKGSKLYAYGDGENFKVYEKNIDDYIDVSIVDKPDLIKNLESHCGSKFEEILTLRFLIPKIKGIFGLWQLDTKGEKSSIPQIVGTLNVLKECAGSIKNIPCDLKIEKVKSQKPGSKSLFPVLTLIPNVSQPHLEMVKDFIESGRKHYGLLNEQKIEQIAEEMSSGPVAIDYDTNVEKVQEVFNGDIVNDLKDIFAMIDQCKSQNDLKFVAEKIKELRLRGEELESARACYIEKMKLLSGG